MELQLAQINIAKMLAPIDSPVLKGFVDNLDRINALAENSSGFVWRLKDDSNSATSIKAFDDDLIIVNMSVWTSLDALIEYVYKSDHVEIFKRKKEWFEKMDKAYMAFWYVPSGVFPSVTDAIERLEYLRLHGDTPYAFTLKKKFSPSDALNFQKEEITSSPL